MRIGVVGLGRAGSMMLRAMAPHPGIQVTAAADVHQQHLARFQEDFGGLAFEDAAALCASPEVDAVYVASPHQYHAEHAVLAAEGRKHILVEKPMALTLEECDRMIEAAERADVALIVGHTASFNPGVQKMRRIIASGEVGRLAMIACNAYSDFLYRPRRQEELRTEQGGGIMFNQVPHQVDAARFVAGGLATSVRAAAWTLDPARPTEGCYAAFLTFEGGPVASLAYSGYDHFSSADLASGHLAEDPRRYGAARRALSGAQTPAEEELRRVASGYSAGVPAASASLLQPELGVFVATCADADLRLAPDGVAVYDSEGLRTVAPDPWRGEPGRGAVLDELLSAGETGQTVIHDGRWAKATLEVCLAMLKSSREQREIALRYQVASSGELNRC
jgi:phthalate 4,5-cis-dihydrodiol dehydrogenase